MDYKLIAVATSSFIAGSAVVLGGLAITGMVIVNNVSNMAKEMEPTTTINDSTLTPQN